MSKDEDELAERDGLVDPRGKNGGCLEQMKVIPVSVVIAQS